MATVVKDFKVKAGLVVEGTTGKINNFDILTKKQADQDYIVGLIGGSSDSANTPNTVVKRDANGDFAASTVTANLVGDVTGNADTATALETPRTIQLTGDVTGEVSFDGTSNVQISTTLDGSFATDSEVATAKSEAIADAATYTDGEISELDASLKLYADQAEADAKTYADGLAVNYDAAGSAAAALVDAKAYADAEIAALVDSAPETLDTLNELAAALQDNPDIISDLQGIAAGKQDALTAGANIDITNDVIAVTGLDTDDVSEGTNLYFTNDRAQAALAGLYDPAGSASAAQTAAESYASGLVNGLDTDDIEEGSTNLYFTDARAQAAVAGDISSAINALDTDDIEEGSTNLYFTNTRAQDAVASDIANAVAAGDDAATPTYLAVDINSVSKQVAATQTVTTASQVVAYSWAKADYKSAEFVVKTSNGTHSEVSKVLLTLDSSDNVAITEYAMVGTNGTLQTVTATVNGNDVEVLVTTSENNSSVTVAGTLIK